MYASCSNGVALGRMLLWLATYLGLPLLLLSLSDAFIKKYTCSNGDSHHSAPIHTPSSSHGNDNENNNDTLHAYVWLWWQWRICMLTANTMPYIRLAAYIYSFYNGIRAWLSSGSYRPYSHGSWQYQSLTTLLANEQLPAMIVQLDVFDSNVERMAAVARRTGKTIRLATKVYRVALITSVIPMISI
jgi:hypothetical protein